MKSQLVVIDKSPPEPGFVNDVSSDRSTVDVDFIINSGRVHAFW